MKKNLFYLFALICSMSLFTACGNDDEPDYSTAIEEEMVGNYKGALDVSVGDGVSNPIPQKISIEKAGVASVNLIINNFNFGGMSLGDIRLLNCNLIQEGKKYTCERSEEIVLKSQVDKVPANVAIVIESGKVTVSLDITWNDIPVLVVYEGTRLSGSESTEAKIIAFSFDKTNEANAIVIEQPVVNNDNTITFRVDEAAVEADANVLKSLVPTFTISDKATSSVESNKAVDFSTDVTIVLLAEDGTVTNYVVKSPTKSSLMKLTFDEWNEVTPSKNSPYVEPLPADLLATPNKGAESLNGSLNPVGYPVVMEEDGYVGKAAKLITRDARGNFLAGIAKAYITAGSIFTGKFVFDMLAAMKPSGALKMTHFGVAYDKKPISFKGVYKYTPGTPFIKVVDKKPTEDKDIIDECTIQAVLYTIASADETLDGTNIDSDDERIVARAQLKDGTAKSDWTAFNLEFEWKEGVTYDAEKAYKLAIVCSSSKDGANFNGAANSTLIIDEFEVIGE